MGFDTGNLKPAQRAQVKAATDTIRGLMRTAAGSAIAIGEKLIEVKALLGHGKFLVWLKAEFDWSRRTGERYIQVAEKFGKCANLSHFAPSALYLLSQDWVPEGTRQEALERAAAGEEITHAKAHDLLEELRNAQAEVPPDPPPYPGEDDPPVRTMPAVARVTTGRLVTCPGCGEEFRVG